MNLASDKEVNVLIYFRGQIALMLLKIKQNH